MLVPNEEEGTRRRVKLRMRCYSAQHRVQKCLLSYHYSLSRRTREKVSSRPKKKMRSDSLCSYVTCWFCDSGEKGYTEESETAKTPSCFEELRRREAPPPQAKLKNSGWDCSFASNSITCNRRSWRSHVGGRKDSVTISPRSRPRKNQERGSLAPPAPFYVRPIYSQSTIIPIQRCVWRTYGSR